MGLMKKLTSSIVASSLVLGLVGTAFAAPTADATNNAFERLSHYNIAKGKALLDGTVDPALNDSITRAEMVTVITRAFGQDETAKILAGAASFNDVAANEWYSGYVALAKNIAEKKGFPIGYEDGTFQPNKQVSAVEALGFIMKYLGVKPATGANWAADTVKAAIEAGVITTADAEAYLADLNAPATRGLAFGLADTIFGSYNKLEGGKTVYTAFVDTQAPVVTLDKIDATTTATSVTVTGKVSGDYTEVFIGSEAIDVNEDGTFEYEAALKEVGENNITVIAKDLAGNEGPATVTVKRTADVADKMEMAVADSEVAVNGETDVTVKVLDKNGAEVEVKAEELTFAVTEGFGKVEDGKFIAGTKAGAATVTVKYNDFTAVADVKVLPGDLAKVVPSAPSAAPGAKVTLSAQDEFGNAIEGATFAIESADALIDSSSATFVAFKAGNYEVTATTKDGKTAKASIGIFADAAKLGIEVGGKLVDNYDAGLNKGSYQTVKVKVLDANGNLNTAAKDAITLTGGALTIKGENSETNAEVAKDGVATFKVYAPAGLRGQLITLNATTTSGLSAGTGAIEIVGQVATKVEISTDEDFIGVDGTSNLLAYTIKVMDQDGVQMRYGVWDAKVTVSGPAVLNETDKPVEKTYQVINGATTGLAVNATQYTTGGITLTASVDGLGTVSKTVNAVFVGAAKQIALSTSADSYTVGGTAVTYTAKVKDQQGALIKDGDAPATLTLDLSALSSTDFGALVITGATATPNTQKFTVAQTTGKNEYKFTVATAKKLTGNVNFKMSGKDKAGTTELAPAEKAIAIKAGTATHFTLDNGTRFLPVAAPTTKVVAQVTDILGNPVAAANRQLTFTATATAPASASDVSFDGTNTAKVYTTDAEGKAIANITVKQYVGNAYTVAVSDPAATSPLTALPVAKGGIATTAITVDSTATAGVSVTVKKKVGGTYENVSFVNAGDDVQVVATVTDTYGVGRVANTNLKLSSADKILVDGDGKLVDASGLTVTFTHAGGGVYTSTDIKVGKAGLVSLSVKDANSAAEVKGDASVLVYAGAAKKISVAEADSTNTVKIAQNSVSGALTLKLTDDYGNDVASAGSVLVKPSVTGTDAAKVVLIGADANKFGINTISTRGTATFYVGVQDLGKTASAASIGFVLSTDGGATWSAAPVYTLNLQGK